MKRKTERRKPRKNGKKIQEQRKRRGGLKIMTRGRIYWKGTPRERDR